MDLLNISFIHQLIKSEGLEKISLLFVIDLSQINNLWSSCESVEKLKTDLIAKIKIDVSFGIIGMKYDLFEVKQHLFFYFNNPTFSRRIPSEFNDGKKDDSVSNCETFRHNN